VVPAVQDPDSSPQAFCQVGGQGRSPGGRHIRYSYITTGTDAGFGSVGVKYPGYYGPSVMAQISGYEQFPPAANGWGSIHLVPDMAPPLLAEEEEPPT
jgi:hypothetical protein